MAAMCREDLRGIKLTISNVSCYDRTCAGLEYLYEREVGA